MEWLGPLLIGLATGSVGTKLLDIAWLAWTSRGKERRQAYIDNQLQLSKELLDNFANLIRLQRICLEKIIDNPVEAFEVIEKEYLDQLCKVTEAVNFWLVHNDAFLPPILKQCAIEYIRVMRAFQESAREYIRQALDLKRRHIEEYIRYEDGGISMKPEWRNANDILSTMIAHSNDLAIRYPQFGKVYVDWLKR